MPKHLEIYNYTSTAPRTRQPSASSPITPLAKHIFNDGVSVAWKGHGGTLTTFRSTVLLMCLMTSNADRIFAIACSASALTFVAVMVCLAAYCKVDCKGSYGILFVLKY